MPTQKRKPTREKRERKHTAAIATTHGRTEIEVDENESIVATNIMPMLTIVPKEEGEKEIVCAECGDGKCMCGENDNVEIASREDELLEIVKPIVCTCIGYDGQDYFCKIHEPRVECPKCNCIDAEIEILPKMDSITHYRCSICGIFYYRVDETGELIHH